MAGLLRRAAGRLVGRPRVGQHVRAGQRRADGHRLSLEAGLHLELREGRWCTDSQNACSPHDQDLGPIDVGDLHGELMTLASGGYVVYVDPGEAPSWTFTGTGMDEAAFRKLIGDLALVRA